MAQCLTEHRDNFTFTFYTTGKSTDVYGPQKGGVAAKWRKIT
jgi:hypothetical protein